MKTAHDTIQKHGYRVKPPLLRRVVINERNLLHLLPLLRNRPPDMLPLPFNLGEAIDLDGGPGIGATLIDSLDDLAIQRLLVPAFLEVVVLELGDLAEPI